MTTEQRVLAVLEQTLELGGRTRAMDADTPLLGALPELDSMAVVLVIDALQRELEIEFEETDITAEAFATVGSLVALVEARQAG
ncbi:acyl carrier protein [Halorhodospira sp. 9621]|uniref:acyl carrier protein n=1 Tax=Halorhodospira TaxID=85108 RepID=UPI001EE84FC4|nr:MULTISPECIES: acyl carrier protein [Halorhodospira]MCG5527997.1 acyl carrier protein [Halorhodospira halophila]MCG5533864.1 acyl carrier protein [Halorhodospira sp. 9621]MCG5542133.1 acyl carrier protein [Halorhodospira sp. 9628]